MSLSEAVTAAYGGKMRGVLLPATGKQPLRVLLAFGRLWVQDGHDVLVLFSPTVNQAIADTWEPSNAV